jgi:23S rRNA (cytidine1920-2'-O)/16S rRNA (cytidine1409-2'-O)-methyltransferase
VIALEGVNARYLTSADIPDPIDLIVCDVSFISLTLVLPPALDLVRPGSCLVALIKPQFEAGPGGVGKGGIVRDPAVRDAARAKIADWLAAQPGWAVEGTVESPIAGGDGNREFLLAARRA